MERHQIARLYWGIIFSIAIIVILQFFTALQPVTFVADNVQNLLGVNVNYNIPETINPFFYSSLDVVKAPTITCTLSTAFFGLTDTNQIIPLSVQTTQAAPYRTSFDLIGGIGNDFTNFSVREMLTCPITNTSYPPNLASGTTTLIWTATKQDGTTVTILNDQQNINPTMNGNTLNLPSGTTPLTGVTLYTWTIPVSQIEGALGVGLLGADFNSLQNISVSNTLTFYQGNVMSVPWTFQNAGPTMISYTLHELTNPTSINTKPINFNQITLSVLSPSNKQLNLQTNRVTTIQGSVVGWQPSMGYPDLKISYVNTAGNGNDIIADYFLKPDVPSVLSSAQTFTFKYALPQNTQTGQYIFSLALAGNPSVPTDTIYVSNTQVSCTSGQYFDGVTNMCKNISTTNCGNGIIVTSGQQCPVPNPQPSPPNTPPSPMTCPTNILVCLSNFNINSFLASGQQAISLAFVFLGFLIFVLIVSAIWHGYHKKEGNEEMMIPSPVEMVEAQ